MRILKLIFTKVSDRSLSHLLFSPQTHPLLPLQPWLSNQEDPISLLDCIFSILYRYIFFFIFQGTSFYYFVHLVHEFHSLKATPKFVYPVLSILFDYPYWRFHFYNISLSQIFHVTYSFPFCYFLQVLTSFFGILISSMLCTSSILSSPPFIPFFSPFFSLFCQDYETPRGYQNKTYVRRNIQYGKK